MFELLAFVFGLSTPTDLPPVELAALQPVPQLVGESPAPVVNAKAALIYDLGSGKVLYEKNAHERRPIASLTKLMTAIVVRKNYDLKEIVTVSENAAAQPPAKVWLRPSEQISVEALLQAALIESGNDAATALAEHYAGGESAFVAAMNTKVTQLGLKNTHFTNPVGYDDENGENYSSAYDLALLGGYVRRDPVLKKIVGTHRTSVLSTNGKIRHNLVSTNILFNSYLDIQGLKTGSTVDAGEGVAAIARMTSGQDVLAIVLDSPNRFQEAKTLLEWADRNHRW